MNVLVVNCGSSSLKFQLINYDNRDVLAKGLCERIGIDGRLVYEPKNGEKEVTEAAMPTHVEAIQMVLDALVNEKSGVIKSLEEVDAIGHRVLHGGMKITNSVIIDDEVIKVIEECADLGPLHNPANLMGINACMKLMPGVPNVAVFDTLAALLAAVVIIPAMAVVLGEGIRDVSGGPGLMFVYLVNVFNAMPAGRIIGAIFYICVLFAGVSSIVNLYEAPIAFLQEQFKFQRAAAVGTIGVIGLVVSIAIQPWTSQWMDVVSIYICPLGALLAGIMFFWIMKKDTALAAVQEGDPKPVMSWFLPFGKYVFVPLCAACFILGIAFGGIG